MMTQFVRLEKINPLALRTVAQVSMPMLASQATAAILPVAMTPSVDIFEQTSPQMPTSASSQFKPDPQLMLTFVSVCCLLHVLLLL